MLQHHDHEKKHGRNPQGTWTRWGSGAEMESRCKRDPVCLISARLFIVHLWPGGKQKIHSGEVCEVCKHVLQRQTEHDRTSFDRQSFDVLCILCSCRRQQTEMQLCIISTLHGCRFTSVDVSLSRSLCPCMPVFILAIGLKMSHPHNSVSLFPRQLLREQLSGTDCCCKVSAPPDRATHNASQHNTRLSSHQVVSLHAASQCNTSQRNTF